MDVLVVTDNFTGQAHAFPCQDQIAKRVGKMLQNFFLYIWLSSASAL